ncbi:MAG: adenylate kinase [Planctomycetes bacterium]|nr:adenylate kinase [Planctomycetota bacterium]
MRIVFLGPPGVGKGTQCRRLVADLRIPHVSTGDMLRRAIRDRTPVGRLAAERMDAGQLVSDDIVQQLVERRLDSPDCAEGWLFDGFPRTIAQAEFLDRMLASRTTPLDLVLELFGDESILVQRMLRRARVEGRTDDTPETVRARMRVYHSQTEPLVEYYARKNLLARIDAIGTRNEVFERIQESVRRARPNPD